MHLHISFQTQKKVKLDFNRINIVPHYRLAKYLSNQFSLIKLIKNQPHIINLPLLIMLASNKFAKIYFTTMHKANKYLKFKTVLFSLTVLMHYIQLFH